MPKFLKKTQNLSPMPVIGGGGQQSRGGREWRGGGKDGPAPREHLAQ